jgi:nucleoside phosphorylase
MDTSKIILFVFDSEDNFNKTKSQLGYEGSTLKRIIGIQNIHQLDDYIVNQLSDDDLVFLVVHVFAQENIKGIKEFLASGITDKFPKLNFMYISDGKSDKEIRREMFEHDIEPQTVYWYHQVLSKLKAGAFDVLTKKELLQSSYEDSETNYVMRNQEYKNEIEYPNCDYAIVTALEETEMEKVLRMIVPLGKLPNKKQLIAYGHLKSHPEKRIAYASQLETGMVDAAILATELIIKFKPKCLIMAGVLAGKPHEVNIGDAVVATKVFTIDKGKITETFKPEIESSNTSNAYVTLIKREKEEIINFIKDEDPTRDNRINIHFGPITCVRQVIDSEGYFDEKIMPIDRKAIALEMESYGIARACEIVNDGNTPALIIKSVMDNATNKNDANKPWAASTSAWVVRYILEKDLIK